MTKETIPYLCGGTFLTQVLRARKELTTPTERTSGKKESLSEQEVLRRLISVFHLSDFLGCSTLKTYTSDYKTCKKNIIEFAGFCNSDLKLSFDKSVKSMNSTALNMMIEFVNDFIDIDNKGEQLIRCLLGLINDDESILESDVFYVNSSSVTKKDLGALDTFVIEPFLLGVWHYIIMHRAECNEIGADTYNNWYPNKKDYRGTIGNDINRSLTIKLTTRISPEPIAASESTTSNGATSDFSSEQYTEIGENANAASVENIQNIEQATIVNQYGDKCIHIEHLDVLNL